MKQIILVPILGLGLLGCKKSDPAKTAIPSYEIMQHPTWNVEAFKQGPGISDYTIQFPTGYSGGLVIGFEGNMFHKYIYGNPDFPVSIRYFFCNATQCYPFGDALSNISQPSVTTYINGIGNQFLDHRIDLTSNGQLVGIIYHNNNTSLKGALYWKDGNEFKNAAVFTGELQKLQEIIEILRTIRKM